MKKSELRDQIAARDSKIADLERQLGTEKLINETLVRRLDTARQQRDRARSHLDLYVRRDQIGGELAEINKQLEERAPERSLGVQLAKQWQGIVNDLKARV